jgi:molecular chaperone HscB
VWLRRKFPRLIRIESNITGLPIFSNEQPRLFVMNSSSHFDLFGFAPAFAIDAGKLEAAYRDLQARVHPDKFAQGTGADRRAAMQWAVRANEAYSALKDPLKRAMHLLELRGVEIGAETNTAMEPAFLMAQMEWRESVEDARAAKNIDELDRLLDELHSEKKIRYGKLEALLASNADQPAAEAVRQLMFLEKVQSEIGDSIAALEDA